MGAIISNLIVVISLMINIWGINFEYIEVKTEGDCGYIARIYLPPDPTDNHQFLYPTYDVDSRYSSLKMRTEIADSLNTFDCIAGRRASNENHSKISTDSINLRYEYRFPCCDDFVLLRYYVSKDIIDLWIARSDSQGIWCILSSFCGGSVIENYNNMVEEFPSVQNMPLICRAMFVLPLYPGFESCDIFESDKDLLYERRETGLGWWILYRYNLKQNFRYVIDFASQAKRPFVRNRDDIKNWGEEMQTRLMASDKSIEAPYITKKGNLDIVHMVISKKMESGLEWWDVSFNTYNGKLFDIKKVDSLK